MAVVYLPASEAVEFDSEVRPGAADGKEDTYAGEKLEIKRTSRHLVSQC